MKGHIMKFVLFLTLGTAVVLAIVATVGAFLFQKTYIFLDQNR